MAPDKEGDEELLERRGRMRSGWKERKEGTMENDEKETEPVIPVAATAPPASSLNFPPSFGRVGYEAYAKATGGKTFDGRAMPTWDELPKNIVYAWERAALEVIAELRVRPR